ncbi:MAG: hypothetical protein SVC26_04625 [Pseudomonadota bacterium]|nr:hypothetical protein [Pseudomonadota bacterium]
MEITRRAITATSLSSLFAIFCSLSHATELETASEEVIISGDEQEVIVDAYSDEIQQTTELEAVEVIAQKTKSEEYIRKQNSTGAIFALTNQETPQAMTFVTHAQIEDFELTTVKDVLSVASGVALEQNEPARFYARSRGFLVDQMATDALAFQWSSL